MYHNARNFRRLISASSVALTLGGVLGCAALPKVPPALMSSSVTVAAPADQSAADTTDGPPAVVIRDYWRSPTISVVGWDPNEQEFGLRARVRRDGSLVRDHQLYVSMYHFVDWSNLMKAVQWTSTPVEKPLILQFEGRSADVHACEGPRGCTPYLTYALRMPDSLLRANRDSVSITFMARDGRDQIITVRRPLIDEYLARFDSLSASLRRQSVKAVVTQFE